MSVHSPLVAECLLAYWALKWLLSSVPAIVFLEVPLVGCSVVTQLTLERAGLSLGVYVLDVTSQHVDRGVDLTTQLALALQLSCMLLGVRHQLTAGVEVTKADRALVLVATDIQVQGFLVSRSSVLTKEMIFQGFPGSIELPALFTNIHRLYESFAC